MREFFFKVLEKFGFNDRFINFVRTLYENCRSAVYINGIISDFFPVERSIRQGCPMSMIAYVIFQEPFYRAIKNCRDIIPISLPNNSSISVAGYADDSSVFVRELNSLIVLSEIVMNFEFATGAKLNREKTKIMGLGNWKDRDKWPLDWLKIEKECKILGIYYSNDYKETVHKNWEICTNKIHSRIKMLSDTFLSLY